LWKAQTKVRSSRSSARTIREVPALRRDELASFMHVKIVVYIRASLTRLSHRQAGGGPFTDLEAPVASSSASPFRLKVISGGSPTDASPSVVKVRGAAPRRDRFRKRAKCSVVVTL